MNAFFQSPNHHNSSNQAQAAAANNPRNNDMSHELTSETTVENSEQMSRPIDLDQIGSEKIQFETLQEVNQRQHQQQLTELAGADIPSSHVKLEMENGQVVVVDSSQLYSVVLVAAANGAGGGDGGGGGDSASVSGEIIIQQNCEKTTAMLLDAVAAHQQDEHNSLVNTSTALGLADHDNKDSIQTNDLDGPNNASMKEIDDNLAMSPGFASALSGLDSQANYMLNVNTFRKTEWDVKKLENYVRLSFNDLTLMEGMQPAKMNLYLVSFFKLAKKVMEWTMSRSL